MPHLFFNGPAGKIEGQYNQQLQQTPNNFALILHPHPKYGGTMDNKVVYNLHRSLFSKGFNTLRFNFRGVGKSEGYFDGGRGELYDAITAIHWLQDLSSDKQKITIVGFSFGAWIALKLLRLMPTKITNFILLSPPSNKYNLDVLIKDFSHVSGQIIQGDCDEIVNYQAVEKLAMNLAKNPDNHIDFRLIKGADHFFQEKMHILKNCVTEYIQQLSLMHP